MNLITPTTKLWQQKQGLQGMYDHIERCARVCYRSENKGNITSEEFVKSLIKRGHYRPLEFGTIVFKVNELPQWFDYFESYRTDILCPYVLIDSSHFVTNLRWLIEICEGENDSWEEILEEWADWSIAPHIYRPTVHWHISRGIADEFRTHTTISSLMESTRYVNYKNKGLEFVLPTWCVGEGVITETFDFIERRYKQMISEGKQPQQAREILPLATATHLVQCGFNKAWNNFFNQRCSSSAHPDAQYIAKQARELFATMKFNEIQNN